MQKIPNVDHVIDGVYIGSARACQSPAELRAAGVKHVLKLCFDADLPGQRNLWPEDFTVFTNSLHDGEPIDPEVLRRGVDFISKQVAAGRPVLVMCAAGISRSSTFVLAFLLERGYSLRDAWLLLHRNHPPAGPLRQMWVSLIEHYRLPDQIDDVMGWLVERQLD